MGLWKLATLFNICCKSNDSIGEILNTRQTSQMTSDDIGTDAVVEMSSHHAALCCVQADKPCPLFWIHMNEATQLLHWAGKVVTYCTIWIFWLSCSPACRSLYYIVLYRVDVSLKKEEIQRSDIWKHEGMIRADMRAESYSITVKFLNFFSNNYDKSVLPTRSSSSNRIQWLEGLLETCDSPV